MILLLAVRLRINLLAITMKSSLYAIFIHTFISLFSIVNPIGMAPIFLKIIKDFSRRERHKTAFRVVIYGIILLVVTLFFGPSVLLFFGISIPLIQIAGGFLVFFTSWEMLNFKSKISPQEKQEASHGTDIAFFPLTMPITAGAGSIAITIAIASNIQPGFSMVMITQYIGAILGILAVFLIVAFCYRFADSIFTRMGQTATSVLTRLFAFILLGISVGLIWDGIRQLILSLS